MEIGVVVVGNILPIGEHFIFFTSFIDLPSSLTQPVIEAVSQLYEESGISDPNQFLSEFYPKILYLFLFGPEPSIEELEWSSPKHLEVAQEFKKYMEENHDEIYLKLGVHLWHQYCSINNPKIVQTSIYCAALIYLVDPFIPYGEMVTQNQLSKDFEISSSSLSAKYRDMESVLKSEIEKLEEKLDSFDETERFTEDKDPRVQSIMSSERELLKLENEMNNRHFESLDEVNHYLDQQMNHQDFPIKTVCNKEKAQELLFDAYETFSDTKRNKLAKEALKLYPNSADAYNILALYEINQIKI